MRQERALCLAAMARLVMLCAFAVVAVVALAACSGGPWPTGDAPATVSGGDSVLGDPCSDGGVNSGSRWQDLYACYFGPSGQASCGAQGSSCHGSATAMGGINFVCGQTQESCWKGLIKAAVPDGGIADPTETLLYSAIRKQGISGGLSNMPLNSTYAFSPAAVAQISAWIEQGAQNN